MILRIGYYPSHPVTSTSVGYLATKNPPALAGRRVDLERALSGFLNFCLGDPKVREPGFGGNGRSNSAESGFRVKIGDADDGEFLDQLFDSLADSRSRLGVLSCRLASLTKAPNPRFIVAQGRPGRAV